jgi:tRNA dimethylallyltransferase
MQAITGGGRIPLLVGGTGLYFRALQSGLSDLPEADPQLRRRLAAQGAEHGWASLHARLAQLDPTAASRIRAGDAQRIQRALEVIELTGRPLSVQQGAQPKRFAYRVLKLALIPCDRALLHARIAQRMQAMIAQGFLDEIRALRARDDLHVDLPALRAVGYRQGWQHLDGQFNAGEFRDRAIFATRQLAKRQLTWLRAELDARALEPFAVGHERTAMNAVADFVGESG